MRSKIFEYLTQTFEAKQFILALFMAKFERVDFEYLDKTNLMMDHHK